VVGANEDGERDGGSEEEAGLQGVAEGEEEKGEEEEEGEEEKEEEDEENEDEDEDEEEEEEEEEAEAGGRENDAGGMEGRGEGQWVVQAMQGRSKEVKVIRHGETHHG